MTRDETRKYINTMQTLCGYQMLYADFEQLLYSDKKAIDDFFQKYDSELKYAMLIAERNM